MLPQSELRVSQDSVGNKQSLRTRALPPSWLVAAATEVLSTPRKWPKGSGQWPFKRQSRPLAPRPTPPWAGWALLWVGAGPCQWERWGGRAGPADPSGGGMIHRLRCGCGCDGLAFPAGVHDLTSTTWLGLESPVHPSILKNIQVSWLDPGRELPRGRMLSHGIPGMPSGHPSEPRFPRGGFPGRLGSKVPPATGC